MKLNQTKTLLTALAASGALALGSSADAATLTSQASIALGTVVDVSVTSGQEGFSTAGGGFTNAFNNPIVDYGFFTNDESRTVADDFNGGSRVGNLSATTDGDSKLNLWAGSATTDPADSATSSVDIAPGTTFTVDISGLESGSIYIFAGSWQARSDWFTASMTGTGQTAVTTDTGDGDGDGNNATFGFAPASTGNTVHSRQIDFDNTGDLYDTITFTFNESGNSNGYFQGVVVTAVPEPGSLALLGMGGLCILRRRRG